MTDETIFDDKNTHEMNTNQLTAKRIKEERIKLNYAQQAVADYLGMDISNYSRLENWKLEITISKLEAIAEFFKIPVVVLIPNGTTSNITINNGSYGNNNSSTMVHNYSDADIQKSLKMVIELLQGQVKK
ncbi:MAG: helix-turn-helix transcriptional regulator [Saprospiraceae bacterium]|nr:helix-turn-helix transcriptional regulator [Saprospiraceae bacterium]MBK8886126.1 helix-turn-helix transcriptional regulator [Saprospiraceae bacterium]